MNTVELKKLFADGQYDELLMDIYLDEEKLEYQKERYVKSIEKFETLWKFETLYKMLLLKVFVKNDEANLMRFFRYAHQKDCSVFG